MRQIDSKKRYTLYDDQNALIEFISIKLNKKPIELVREIVDQYLKAHSRYFVKGFWKRREQRNAYNTA